MQNHGSSFASYSNINKYYNYHHNIYFFRDLKKTHLTNNLKKWQKSVINNFSGPVTPRLSYLSWKIVRNIIGITACPRTSTRYLLKAQLSDPPVHVIWPVLRVHRQRVAIMFAISTCIYVRRSNDRHVRSDSQLRRTRHRTMLHRYIWIVDMRSIR